MKKLLTTILLTSCISGALWAQGPNGRAIASLGAGYNKPGNSTTQNAYVGNGLSINGNVFVPFYSKEGGLCGNTSHFLTIGFNVGGEYLNSKQLYPLDGYATYPINGQSAAPTPTALSGKSKQAGFSAEAGIQANYAFGKFNLSPALNAGYLHFSQDAFSIGQSSQVNGRSVAYNLYSEAGTKTNGIAFRPKLRMSYFPGRLGFYIEGNYTTGPEINKETNTFKPQGSINEKGFYSMDQMAMGTITTQTKSTAYNAMGFNVGISLALGRIGRIVGGGKTAPNGSAAQSSLSKKGYDSYKAHSDMGAVKEQPNNQPDSAKAQAYLAKKGYDHYKANSDMGAVKEQPNNQPDSAKAQAYLAKKGYDHYKAKGDMASAGTVHNPYYQSNDIAGEMPNRKQNGKTDSTSGGNANPRVKSVIGAGQISAITGGAVAGKTINPVYEDKGAGQTNPMASTRRRVEVLKSNKTGDPNAKNILSDTNDSTSHPTTSNDQKVSNNPLYQSSGTAGSNPINQAAKIDTRTYTGGRKNEIPQATQIGTNPLYTGSGQAGTNPMSNQSAKSDTRTYTGGRKNEIPQAKQIGTNPLYNGNGQAGTNPMSNPAAKRDTRTYTGGRKNEIPQAKQIGTNPLYNGNGQAGINPMSNQLAKRDTRTYTGGRKNEIPQAMQVGTNPLYNGNGQAGTNPMSNQSAKRDTRTYTGGRKNETPQATQIGTNPLYKGSGQVVNNPMYEGLVAGQPIGDVAVKGGKNPGGNSIKLVSDQKGTFEFKVSAAGNYTFTFTATPQSEAKARKVARKAAKKARAAHAVIQNPLYNEPVSTGNNPRYQGFTSGTPIGGIIVKGGKNPGGILRRMVTAPNGSIVLENLEPGNYTFTITAPTQGKSISEKGVSSSKPR